VNKRKEIPGRPPEGSKEDLRRSQETPKGAQGLPRRPQEAKKPQKAPEGSRSFPESTQRRIERFGFRIEWLREVMFATPVGRNAHFIET
jgi:hypothetical protein